MALRRHRSDEESAEKWLEVDASMTGTVAFKDPVNLKINGKFDGSLEAKGSLLIGERAQVKATIRGETITIGGTVSGTITALSRVEMLSGARVKGKITSPRIVMSDGAIVDGTLEMSGAQPEGPWMTVDDLARYLEVDAATVGQWAQSGRLPAQRDNDTWRFDRAKIEEWLANEKIK